MRTNGLKAAVMVIGLVAALGMASNVFAGKGYGRGDRDSDGDRRGWNCPGYGPRAGLSEEQSARLDSERQAFMDATADLRREIRQKDLELQSELAKKEIDAAKAHAIQKELSDLEAQFDQKRLDQRMKLKDVDPDWGGGPMRGYGRGMGRRGGCW